MRMDLARGWERRSTTATEAAEIDFMNIKQQGVDTGTGLLQSTRGHAMVGFCKVGCIGKDFFFCRISRYSTRYSNKVIVSHTKYFSVKNEVGQEMTQNVSKLPTQTLPTSRPPHLHPPYC